MMFDVDHPSPPEGSLAVRCGTEEICVVVARLEFLTLCIKVAERRIHGHHNNPVLLQRTILSLPWTRNHAQTPYCIGPHSSRSEGKAIVSVAKVDGCITR